MAEWTTTNQDELAALEAKKKLNAKDKARLRILKTLKASQERRALQSEPESSPVNAFSVVPTTQVIPYAVRFIEDDHTGLSEREKQIWANEPGLVLERLGHRRGLNKTKLIRAACLLLNKHSDQEVIEAIAEVNRGMYAHIKRERKTTEDKS